MLEASNKVCLYSKHVVFDEDTFPYKSSHMVSNSTNLEIFDFPSLNEWLGSTNKRTTSSVDSQILRSLINSKEESFNIFPYYCNPNFIASFIPNIVGNNEENQPSLNDITTPQILLQILPLF